MMLVVSYRLQVNEISDVDSDSMESISQCLFSFGLITDVQYAERENGMNFLQTRKRYYRKALQCLDVAVTHWEDNENIKFILQLGDLIDGSCRKDGTSQQCFDKLHQAFGKYHGPIAHCWGNHELYNYSREYLLESSSYPKTYIEVEDQYLCNSSVMMFMTSSYLKNECLCCYHFMPHLGFRFIVIDCYDISVLGRDKSHVKARKAREFLSSMNPNMDKNDHNNAVCSQYVAYNGEISSEQLLWIENVLSFSDKHSEKVIISGHIPIHPEATRDSICLVWNNDEMLNLIQRHKCVVAYFAGHDHDGAQNFVTPEGVHHCTFKSVLEAVPKSEGGNQTAFATIDVFPDKLVIRGEGDIKSETLYFSAT